MLSRTLEVVLIALLVMLTLGVAFQFQNQQLLRDILVELQHQRSSTQHAARPAPAPPEVPRATYQLPTTVVTPVAPAPSPAMLALVEESAAPAPAPPVPPATPEPEPVVVAAPPPPAPAAKMVQPKQPAKTPAVPAPAPAPPAPPAVVSVKPEPDPKVEEAWQAHGPIVTQIVTDLYDGQYDRVVKRLNSTMAASLPVERIAMAMDPIRLKHGALKAVADHELLTGALEPNLRGWKVVAEQNDGARTEFWITLDDQNRIAGLFMK